LGVLKHGFSGRLLEFDYALFFRFLPFAQPLLRMVQDLSYRNSELNADFVIWNRQIQLGKVFDSSTCFHLPGGSVGEASSSSFRSPDVAWVRQERWEELTPEQQEKFPPLAPDFVLELMSPSDVLAEAQAKMEEYRDSGVRLGWLIRRKQRRVWIYRPENATQLLDNPRILSGEEVLPGFSLNTKNIW
jgi:Uma2 family endonuclease